MGDIWLIKAGPEELVPYLDCEGGFNWTDVEPGSTVMGEFTVGNVGDSGSLLDWEVSEYPGWGNWTFIPWEGYDLKPEVSPVTVGVSVVAPDEEDAEFSGFIKVVNREDSDNYEIIPVRLVTPRCNELFGVAFFVRIVGRFPLIERVLLLHPMFSNLVDF